MDPAGRPAAAAADAPGYRLQLRLLALDVSSGCGLWPAPTLSHSEPDISGGRRRVGAGMSTNCRLDGVIKARPSAATPVGRRVCRSAVSRVTQQGRKDCILGSPWEHTHPQQDDSHGKS
jgi:hypothetical protein